MYTSTSGVYELIISFYEGFISKHAFTEEAVLKKLFSYVKANWSEVSDFYGKPMPEKESEAIKVYFEIQRDLDFLDKEKSESYCPDEYDIKFIPYSEFLDFEDLKRRNNE